MTWIYAYEAQIIETALERINDDDPLLQNVATEGEIPVRIVSELVYERRRFPARRSRMAEVSALHSILAWLEGKRTTPFQR